MTVRLTHLMREALEAAAKQPLRRTHTPGPGQPAWPAHPASLHALVRHGLLDVTDRPNRHGIRVTVWTITDTGRQILEPPAPRRIREQRFLAARSEDLYTSHPAFAMAGEPEAIPEELQEHYSRQAQERDERRAAAKRATQGRRRLSERVAELEARRGEADIKAQLASIARRVEAAERRLGKDAA